MPSVKRLLRICEKPGERAVSLTMQLRLTLISSYRFYLIRGLAIK